MCRSNNSPDGPRSCSADKRDNFASATARKSALTQQDEELTTMLAPEVRTEGEMYAEIDRLASEQEKESRYVGGLGGDPQSVMRAPVFRSVANTLNTSGREAAIADAREQAAKARDIAEGAEWSDDPVRAHTWTTTAEAYDTALQIMGEQDQQPPPADSRATSRSSAAATGHSARPAAKDVNPVAALERKSWKAMHESQRQLVAAVVDGKASARVEQLLAVHAENEARYHTTAEFAAIERARGGAGTEDRERAVRAAFDQQLAQVDTAVTAGTSGGVDGAGNLGRLKALRSVTEAYSIADEHRRSALAAVAEKCGHSNFVR